MSINIFGFGQHFYDLDVPRTGIYVKLLLLCVDLEGCMPVNEIFHHILAEEGAEKYIDDVNYVLKKHFYMSSNGWRHKMVDAVILDNTDTQVAH